MPDEMKGAVDTATDSSTPEQPPPPPPPPPVEGNKDGVGPHDEGNRNNVQETNVEPEPQHWTRYAEALCAIALVLITAYYTRAAFRQAVASETAANSARDAVKVATNTLCETQLSSIRQEHLTDEARVSSERDSEKAIRATQDAMRLDQRAWVAMASVTGALTLNQPWVVHLGARNTGKTFAKNFRERDFISRIPRKDAVPDFDPRNLIPYGSVSILPPNGDYTADIPVTGEDSNPHVDNPSQIDLDNIKSGDWSIYAFGKLEYDDIFRVHHWTTYCFFISRKDTWESCRQHNDADDNTQILTPEPLTPSPITPQPPQPPCPAPKAN